MSRQVQRILQLPRWCRQLFPMRLTAPTKFGCKLISDESHRRPSSRMISNLASSPVQGIHTTVEGPTPKKLSRIGVHGQMGLPKTFSIDVRVCELSNFLSCGRISSPPGISCSPPRKGEETDATAGSTQLSPLFQEYYALPSNGRSSPSGGISIFFRNLSYVVESCSSSLVRHQKGRTSFAYATLIEAECLIVSSL